MISPPGKRDIFSFFPVPKVLWCSRQRRQPIRQGMLGAKCFLFNAGPNWTEMGYIILFLVSNVDHHQTTIFGRPGCQRSCKYRGVGLKFDWVKSFKAESEWPLVPNILLGFRLGFTALLGLSECVSQSPKNCKGLCCLYFHHHQLLVCCVCQTCRTCSWQVHSNPISHTYIFGSGSASPAAAWECSA